MLGSREPESTLQVELACTYRPLDSQEIESLESVKKVRLPESYRRFLLQNNGGIAADTVVEVPNEHVGPKLQTFSSFFSLEGPHDDFHLFNMKTGLNRFCFACDSFGNHFTFPIVNGTALDRVEFVEVDGPARVSAAWPAFNLFLRSIKYAPQPPESEEPWERAIRLNDAKLLLENMPSRTPDRSNDRRWTVAETCCLSYRPKCFKAAVAKGDLGIGIRGRSVLHVCAENGFIDGIRHVLTLGVSVDQRQTNGETPLMIAARSNSCSCLEFLLATGADRTVRGPDGATFIDHLSYANKAWYVRYGESVRKPW